MKKGWYELSNYELEETNGGSLTTVIVMGTASLLAIAVYKLFQSYKGKLTLPGGFGLEWQLK